MSAPDDAGELARRRCAGGVDRALVAVSSELVGVCDRALEMTVAYVKDRKQFGVPVGAYQAVSHRCAQMLLDTEKARSTAAFAAWTADADPDGLAEAAAMAKAAASDAGREVTAERDPGARRHRLHLGGGRALAVQARPARRRAARRRQAQPRAAGGDPGRTKCPRRGMSLATRGPQSLADGTVGVATRNPFAAVPEGGDEGVVGTFRLEDNLRPQRS